MPEAPLREKVLAAFCYAASSVLILVFNKIVLTHFKFKYHVLMTMLHMLVCVVVISLARPKLLLSFDWELARRAFPLSICFVCNVVLGMVGLGLISIPMFATLRRLTVMLVILNEYLMLGKRPAPNVVIAVSVMLLGSLIGGWGDLQFDLFGYLYVLANNMMTALYQVWIKKALSQTAIEKDKLGILFYNSLLSIPSLVVLATINGEIFAVTSFPHLQNLHFQLAFVLSAFMSFLLNYSTFWCTDVNSALTTSVVGQLKNVLSSFISVLAFPTEASAMLITGLSVGLSGSFLYGYEMYNQEQRQKASNNNNNGNGSNSVGAAASASPSNLPAASPSSVSAMSAVNAKAAASPKHGSIELSSSTLGSINVNGNSIASPVFSAVQIASSPLHKSVPSGNLYEYTALGQNSFTTPSGSGRSPRHAAYASPIYAGAPSRS